MAKFFTVALSTAKVYVRDDPEIDELLGRTVKRYCPSMRRDSNLPSLRFSSGCEQQVLFHASPDLISSDA